MENILFKSKIVSEYRDNWICFLSVSQILLIIPVLYLIQQNDPFIGESPQSFIRLITFILLSIYMILIWYSFQFFGSYLIIYQNGIKIRKPYRLLRYKFIPWNLIRDLKLEAEGMIGINKGDDHIYNAIYIFLKDQSKSINISEIWVEEINSVYNLMIKYIELIKVPKFCKNHSEIAVYKQCRSCGDYVCDVCIEEKSYRRIYCECTLCLFNLGLNRIKKIYLLTIPSSLTYFIFMLISLFVNLYQNWIALSIIVFPFLLSLFSIFFLIPTAYGMYLATIRRRGYLKKLNIKFSDNLFKIVSLLIIPFFIFDYLWLQFWFIQKLDINIPLFITYLFFTTIIMLITFLFERPRKTAKFKELCKLKICPNCTQKLDSDSEFCANCGINLKKFYKGDNNRL